jgi:hypothetical protein
MEWIYAVSIDDVKWTGKIRRNFLLLSDQFFAYSTSVEGHRS